MHTTYTAVRFFHYPMTITTNGAEHYITGCRESVNLLVLLRSCGIPTIMVTGDTGTIPIPSKLAAELIAEQQIAVTH